MKRHAPEETEDKGGPLFDTPKARATDPATSHAAAAELKRDSVTRLRAVVLNALRGKPMDDTELVVYIHDMRPQYSASGIRTRRSELVELNLVRDSGLRQKLLSGRMAIIWEAI